MSIYSIFFLHSLLKHNRHFPHGEQNQVHWRMRPAAGRILRSRRNLPLFYEFLRRQRNLPCRCPRTAARFVGWLRLWSCPAWARENCCCRWVRPPSHPASQCARDTVGNSLCLLPRNVSLRFLSECPELSCAVKICHNNRTSYHTRKNRPPLEKHLRTRALAWTYRKMIDLISPAGSRDTFWPLYLMM